MVGFVYGVLTLILKVSMLINIKARTECNRCKKTKNSRKKHLDPITGLYIEKPPKSFNPISTFKCGTNMVNSNNALHSIKSINNQFLVNEYQNQFMPNFTNFKASTAFLPIPQVLIGPYNKLYNNNISNNSNFNQSSYMFNQGLQHHQLHMLSSSVPEFNSNIVQSNSNYFNNNNQFLSNFGANQHLCPQKKFRNTYTIPN